MPFTRTRVALLVLAFLLAAPSTACRSPSHSDSTKGTPKKERSDTGMHDGAM